MFHPSWHKLKAAARLADFPLSFHCRSSRIYRVPSLLGPPLIRSESREGSPIAFQGTESSEEGRCVGVLRGHQGKHVWRVVLCPSAKLVGCARVDSRDDASEDAVLRVHQIKKPLDLSSDPSEVVESIIFSNVSRAVREMHLIY